jgi:hypothetical protein
MTLEFRERRLPLGRRVERRPQRARGPRPGGSALLVWAAGRGSRRPAAPYGDSCPPPAPPPRPDASTLAFDDETGLLTAEAGVSLGELMRIFVPRGWFPPVTPGTRFVTLGGAVANDVHGKNHEAAGTFGRHVAALTLLRSDVGEVTCSPAENAELFAATLGGLGLTVITGHPAYAHRVGPIDAESRLRLPDAFFELNAESERGSSTRGVVRCTAGRQPRPRHLLAR